MQALNMLQDTSPDVYETEDVVDSTHGSVRHISALLHYIADCMIET